MSLRPLSMAAAGLLVLFNVLALIAVCEPGSPPARWIAAVAPFAEPHAAAAEAALARRDFGAAEAETRAELRVSPVRASAWLRLTRIDLARHDALTPEGLAALEHAYDAKPYDLDPRSARMPIVLQRYAMLSPSARASATDELQAWALSPVLKARLKQMAGDASPAGRTAVAQAVDATP